MGDIVLASQAATKRCTKCRQWLPRNSGYFYTDRRASDGLRSDCKFCTLKDCRARVDSETPEERQRRLDYLSRYGKARRPRREKTSPSHGTMPSYRRGCRCDACVEVNRRYQATKTRYPVNEDKYYLNKYGITADQRDLILASQGGVCPICGTDEPKSRKGWHTDHCHETGKIRGILCHQCNIVIGMASDDVARLRRAIAYLEAWA